MIYTKQTITTEELILSYRELKSVWKVGEKYGIRGQSVHERLTKAGVVKGINYFTESDKKLLLELYPIYKANNNLVELAKLMKRTKQFICRKAKELGITSRSNPLSEKLKRNLSIKASERLKKNGHPKGFKGHKHTPDSKIKMSILSKRNWQNPKFKLRSEDATLRRSDTMFKNRINGKIQPHSNRKECNETINHKEFNFKSSWEFGFALVLEKLRINGSILSWDYEPTRFIFDDVKVGIRSYLPDFAVFNKRGETIFFEVKGWKMNVGMKRIEMFKERFPNIKLHIIDEYEYKKVISETNYLLRYTE